MITAGERLRQLSGLAGVSAAVMLLAIGTGATAGELLASRSCLPIATAAEHLLADCYHAPPAAQQVFGGSAGGGRSDWTLGLPYHEPTVRHNDDDEVLQFMQMFLATRHK